MDSPDYGLWMLFVMNSATFIMFAPSSFKPQALRDWRSFGAFSAFLVAPSVSPARHEEKEASPKVADAYQPSVATTPAGWPVLRRHMPVSPHARV